MAKLATNGLDCENVVTNILDDGASGLDNPRFFCTQEQKTKASKENAEIGESSETASYDLINESLKDRVDNSGLVISSHTVQNLDAALSQIEGNDYAKKINLSGTCQCSDRVKVLELEIKLK